MRNSRVGRAGDDDEKIKVDFWISANVGVATQEILDIAETLRLVSFKSWGSDQVRIPMSESSLLIVRSISNAHMKIKAETSLRPPTHPMTQSQSSDSGDSRTHCSSVLFAWERKTAARASARIIGMIKITSSSLGYDAEVSLGFRGHFCFSLCKSFVNPPHMKTNTYSAPTELPEPNLGFFCTIHHITLTIMFRWSRKPDPQRRNSRIFLPSRHRHRGRLPVRVAIRKYDIGSGAWETTYAYGICSASDMDAVDEGDHGG